MGELELLERNYEQAKQNFDYADKEHRNKAIYELMIADEELRRYNDKCKRKGRKKCSLRG